MPFDFFHFGHIFARIVNFFTYSAPDDYIIRYDSRHDG